MNKGFDSRLDQGWWVLRIGLGVGPFLAGLDKHFNLLTNWTGYISPLVGTENTTVQRTNLHAHRRCH
jgi:hypothetical protein